MKRSSKGQSGVVVLVLVGIAMLGIALLMFILPLYGIWNQEQDGKAQLAGAEYSKRVAVETSKAKKDAAQFEADAEIIRATGVAKANMIIGQSLKNNESYLRYLWIHSMEGTKNQVIYVPTEASLPILEAGKRVERKED